MGKLVMQKDTLVEGFEGQMDYFKQLLIDNGVKESLAGYLSYGIIIVILLILCFLLNLIMRKVVLRILTKIIRSNKMVWDDVLLEHRVIHRGFHIIPGIIVYMAAPLFDKAQGIIQRLATTYVLIVSVFVLNAVLDSVDDIYRMKPISKVRPIKGLLQVIKIIAYIILAIIGIANLMGESPVILLSSIGALAALFSFVFKDSILGFIAGIQLTSNDMLRIGDVIEMSKYGADGEVIDITLNTVKVQNFDKSIITIPAYALISDSFKNWRGMVEFGGRRIKRAIYIDVNSISFCTPEMLERFKRFNYLKDYIMGKEKELTEYNSRIKLEEEPLINGRYLTNIGTFRAYIQSYLMNHPDINKDLIQMVRQLPPGENGLPLEIYAFTTNPIWVSYEGTQADIFDHILSIAGEFGLRIFQNPSGHDLKQINSGNDNRNS